MSTRGDQPRGSASSPPNVWSSIRLIRSLICSNSLSGLERSTSPLRRSGTTWDMDSSFGRVHLDRRLLGDASYLDGEIVEVDQRVLAEIESPRAHDDRLPETLLGRALARDD